MVDESMDKDQMKLPPQPWEFRSKPAWQRLIIMIGGVTVNVFLGIFIYSMILWGYGKEVVPVDGMPNGIFCDSYMLELGFRDGDVIAAVDGEKPEDFVSVNKWLLLKDIKVITVNRDGSLVDVAIPDGVGHELVNRGVKSSFTPRIFMATVVDSVLPGLAAEKAGLQVGDSIQSINGIAVNYQQEVQRILQGNREKDVEFLVRRNGADTKLNMTVSKKGAVGFVVKADDAVKAQAPRVDTLQYSFFEAIPGGFKEAWEVITDQAVSMKFLFSKAGVQQLGGFITIAKIFPNEWNWWAFWEKTAFISLILAFMNILPIPALDGGHVIFLVWEVITGRQASQKVLEAAQMIGMVLLLALLLYANGMDIFRLATE
jgi:regulator of sigma E protease